MFSTPLPPTLALVSPSLATVRDILIYCALFRVLRWLLKPFYVPSPLSAIPGPPSESWFKGNLGQLFTAKGIPFHEQLVTRYGGMVKVHGFFGDEQLYISDPRALQSILGKEADAYEETAVFVESNRVIFGPGLVSTTGVVHKRQRKLVGPIFSTRNLRELVPVFYGVAERLSDVLVNETRLRNDSNGRSVLDMSDWMSRVALESVGQAVLNYSFDPLDSPATNAYTRAIHELIPTLFSLSLIRQFAPFLVRLGPPWLRRKLVEWTPNAAVQKVRGMSDVMHETAVRILDDARASFKGADGEEGTQAKDIMSLLLRANEKAGIAEQLSEAELTGQLTVMIFGAQDTTGAALSRILHLLARRPDVQHHVRQEIRAAQLDGAGPSGRLPLETVSALPWLDAVLKETLRLYPPVPFVRRTALEDRIVPFASHTHTGDGAVSAVTIPRGTTLFLSIAGGNRLASASVWGTTDAAEWRPERWLGNSANGELNSLVDPGARLPGIYAGMLSFLGGERSCVGCRFALIEMKILLITLLSRFELSLTDDEIVWNLSQIISPSVKRMKNGVAVEEKGLPLYVKLVTD